MGYVDGKVIADISMSLDGYIAGPGDGSPDHPLGAGGERLHQWVYGLASWRERHGMTGGDGGRDSEILDEAFRDMGAVVLGRRMYDNADGWGDEPPFQVPVFVLTHQAREPIAKRGGTTFTFVTGGVTDALRRARSAAGDRNVSVAGGAQTIQGFLDAGLLDEIQVHLVPVLLGGGRRLFGESPQQPVELDPVRVVGSPTVTHLRYRVLPRRPS
jgi:dihydrofolate reductase